MKRLCIQAAVFFAFIVAFSVSAENNPSFSQKISLPEIHLLVDVSGSMKKTDPQNLRAKSIKMFLFLMQQKALMSIDSFATTSNTIIPKTIVNGHFATSFLKKEVDISSDGAWTNMELALNNAMKSWSNANKVIILLTDGKIDLGSDAQSKASRNTVLTRLIKQLQDAQIRVFTIGFSQEADKKLLNKIALSTNAIPQVIDSSEDIEGTLYKIFTAIIPVNGITIEKNPNTTRTIQVDKNIKEMTLIFKRNGGMSQVDLISPKGKKSAIKDISQNGGLNQNYIFVTLDKPQAGLWTLSGPEQDIERAVVLTDVTLVSTFNSGVYFIHEQALINAHMENKTTIIKAPLIVDNIAMKLKMQHQSKEYLYNIPYKNDGQFSTIISFNNPAAKYTLILSARSDYLSRELQFIIDLQPLPFKHIENLNGTSILELMHSDLIKADSVRIKAVVDTRIVDVLSNKNHLIWNINLAPVCQMHFKKLGLKINAQTTNSRDVEFLLPLKGSHLCLNRPSSLHPISLSNASHIEKIKLNHTVNKEKTPVRQRIFFYTIYILLLTLALFICGLIIALAYAKKIKKIKTDLTSENKND